MREQITDRDREIVIRVHEPGGRRHDPVPVGVRVVREREPIAVLQRNEPRHRVRARAVHPDLTIVIDRHEAEGRVDARVHDVDVEPIARVDRLPIADRRAAERIDAEREPGRADRAHVDDVREVVDVRADEVLLVNPPARARGLEREPAHAGVAGAQELVRAVLHPACHVRVGRSAVRRVVLEAAVGRRVVRRRHDDAVREVLAPATVVDEDRARDHGRRRNAVRALNDRVDAVRGEHLERGALRGRGERVCVLA